MYTAARKRVSGARWFGQLVKEADCWSEQNVGANTPTRKPHLYEHVVASLEKGQQGAGDGCHATCQRQSVFCACSR